MKNKKNCLKIVIVLCFLDSFLLNASSSSRRRTAAAQSAAAEQKSKEISSQFKAAWEKSWGATKEGINFITPEWAKYIYEQTLGAALDWMRTSFPGYSQQLNEIANQMDKINITFRQMLTPILKAPDQLRQAAHKIDTGELKKVNEALALVKTQRDEVIALNLKGKGIVELAELEILLLKSFEELEKFLSLLQATLTETRNSINGIIPSVTNGVKSIENNANDVVSRISRAEFGYPGLPARLRAIGKIINP